jgi:hypothetical protein
MATVAKLQENTADTCIVYLENLMLKVWQHRILLLSEQQVANRLPSYLNLIIVSIGERVRQNKEFVLLSYRYYRYGI